MSREQSGYSCACCASDVLVHGVDVEEVVLHLPDDAPEGRQVLAQNPEQIHAAQLVRDPARLAKDLPEASAVFRVAAKGPVDALPVPP